VTEQIGRPLRWTHKISCALRKSRDIDPSMAARSQRFGRVESKSQMGSTRPISKLTPPVVNPTSIEFVGIIVVFSLDARQPPTTISL
jgi:hypothetical protein